MRTHFLYSLAAVAWAWSSATAADDLASKVEAVGELIEFNETGEAIAIDLYNGNNPLKGKRGRNELVTQSSRTEVQRRSTV